MHAKLAVAVAAAAAALLSTTTAAPQLIAPFGTEVELCTRPNFKGDCVSMFVEHNTCTSFPDGFHNAVSSLSLVQGWGCTLFMSASCSTHLPSMEVDWTGDFSHMSFGNNAMNAAICNLGSS